MFINKLHEKSNSSKMSSYINLFLKTEITCIPKLLQNYLGNYYSNALCNGATWVFVLWCVLHIIFDKIIDMFLTKLRYKEYVRIRIKSSLWYLGFYGTALVYCSATLAQNEVELFNFKTMQVPTNSSLPTQVILGHTLISTFYLHSSLWEGLMKQSIIRMFSYLFLFALLLSSYILRIVEISFTLTALIGIAQVAIEFTRCCFMLSNQDTLISKLIVGMLYFITFAIYVALYIIVIPLTFVAPYGLKIMSDYPNIMLLFVFINMVLWLITDIYQSILFKFVDHWFYHENISQDEYLSQCSGSLLECSMFKPRDDVSYNLQILREEIKSRETKMMSMRKPKNKNMLIQTLKCMVAIKRKLNEKRLSDSSDSDDSEKSEDSDLRTSENTDEDTGELHSDQDEESDDEESESQESVIETKKVKFKKPDVENADFSKSDYSNESQESVIETKKVKQESEDEKVDFNKTDSNDNDKRNVDVKSKEESTITSKESTEIKCDETNKPDDEHIEFSKSNNNKSKVNASTNVNLLKGSNINLEEPENSKSDTKEPKDEHMDFGSSNITSLSESNIKSEQPVENKCDNSKEPDENIDNSDDKHNINVKSIEESNVKSEEPSGNKCDNTKESEGDIDVKSIEKTNVKIKKEVDKGNKSNQVSEKAHSSVSEFNVIAKLQLMDDVEAQSDDKKSDLKSEEVKESDAASTSRFENTE